MNKILNLIKQYNVERLQFVNDGMNKNYINQYVNHIYIINLKHNKIRRNYVVKLMEKYNINFELISVPKLNEQEYNIISENNKITLGEAGCYLSHMFCLNDAIIKDYSKIIIFEDDIILHKRFNELFEETTKKKFYDILMLGASDFHFNKLNSRHIDTNINAYKPQLETKSLYGTYSILYSNCGLKEVFITRLKTPTFFDDKLIQFIYKFNNTFYVLYPNLVVSDFSTTDINHKFWITSEALEKYYYKCCFDANFNFIEYNFIYLKLLELITINESISYEKNILETLFIFFRNNTKKINKIKNRLVYNFFSISDLKYIIFTQ